MRDPNPPENPRIEKKIMWYEDSRWHEEDTNDILDDMPMRPENLEQTREYINEAVETLGVNQIFGKQIEQHDFIACVEEFVRSRYVEAAKTEAIIKYRWRLENGEADET